LLLGVLFEKFVYELGSTFRSLIKNDLGCFGGKQVATIEEEENPLLERIPSDCHHSALDQIDRCLGIEIIAKDVIATIVGMSERFIQVTIHDEVHLVSIDGLMVANAASIRSSVAWAFMTAKNHQGKTSGAAKRNAQSQKAKKANQWFTLSSRLNDVFDDECSEKCAPYRSEKEGELDGSLHRIIPTPSHSQCELHDS
jgi:hypothetical protein